MGGAQHRVWLVWSVEGLPARRKTRKPDDVAGFKVYFPVVDLLDLLQRLESKTLEFKRDLSSADGVLRGIVAFANSAGGILLIGVEDAARFAREPA